MPGVFIERGNLDIDRLPGSMPCGDEGRDQGDASVSLGRPQITSKLPEARNQILLHDPQREPVLLTP